MNAILENVYLKAYSPKGKNPIYTITAKGGYKDEPKYKDIFVTIPKSCESKGVKWDEPSWSHGDTFIANVDMRGFFTCFESAKGEIVLSFVAMKVEQAEKREQVKTTPAQEFVKEVDKDLAKVAPKRAKTKQVSLFDFQEHNIK